MKSLSSTKFIQFATSLSDVQKASLTIFIKKEFASSTEMLKVYNFVIAHKKLQALESIKELANQYRSTMETKQMANYLSLLFNASARWMVTQQLALEPDLQDHLIYKWMNRQGLDQLASLHLDRLNSSSIKDEATPQIDILFTSLLTKIETLQFNQFPTHKEEYAHLSSMIDTMRHIRAQIFGAINIELSSIIQITKYDPDILIDVVNTELENTTAGFLSSIFYDDLQKILRDEDVVLFHKYIESMLADKTNTDTLSHHIRYMVLHKVASKLWIKEKLKDKKIFLDIINYRLESGATAKNQNLTTSHFHNLVNRVAMIYDFAETEKFINRWITKVKTKNISTTKDVADAQNMFYHDVYEGIEKFVWRSEFDNFNQKNIASSINLAAKFMFRKKGPVAFELAVEQYRSLLKRNKENMSEFLFQSANNFIHFLLKVDQKEEVTLHAFEPLLYKEFCKKIINKPVQSR
jgi:hypothetical protein